MSNERTPQNCNGCGKVDTEPRHHVYDPNTPADQPDTKSFCFQCATDLGVLDYSAVIAAAEAEGLTLTQYVLKEI